jgi:broad specificity phosphatase PhoE
VAAPTWLLIRHAESTWNAAGRWQGCGDPPLSPHGRRQAERLAAELEGEGVEWIVASDLARAAETAAILGRALGLSVVVEPGLRELDAGAWTGLARVQIAESDTDALERFDARDPDARAGGGECRREVLRRARRALAVLAAQQPGRRVAVVTHQGVIESLVPELRLGNAEWQRVSAKELGVDSSRSG